MIAAELLSAGLPVLSKNDSVSKALNLMKEFKVAHLPVVNLDEYSGLISETFLLSLSTKDILEKHMGALVRPFLFEDQHLFDALKLIDTFKISLVPVLDKNEKFLGSFTEFSLADALTALTAVQQSGGIIILEMPSANYTLTQIAQIVEENGARILACYLISQQETNTVEVTLKINREDLSSIIQTFTRYNYSIKATFHQSENDEDMRRRFELFMNYINM